MAIYRVEAGDTPLSVANRFRIPLFVLLGNNGLTAETPLTVGQSLVILTPSVVDTVAAGETLYTVARRNQISVIQLYRNNPDLEGIPTVEAGRQLVIRYEQEPTEPLDVNAYAYPFITTELLRKTLPFLTDLTPFTYGFTREGTLVAPDDQRMIDLALEYGVKPWLHLSTLSEAGVFDRQLGLNLLQDEAWQQRLIESVVTTMQEKNYQGLDVDFEFLGAEGADLYADFINRLRQRLNPLGYEVVVALAPKVSADQPGTLYEGHDYAALGAAADGVLLMTYEWGYTYGPPMAVAPIPSVRRVLDYAVTEIPREKIFMGVPTYGYDWPLPYEKGVTKARSLSYEEALRTARNFGAEIQYDETAQAPFYQYTDKGVVHEVWFEDARSILAKFQLVKEYGFHGVGYWNADRPFPPNWSLLNSQYRIVTFDD